jgi:hypothetical protein
LSRRWDGGSRFYCFCFISYAASADEGRPTRKPCQGRGKRNYSLTCFRRDRTRDPNGSVRGAGPPGFGTEHRGRNGILTNPPPLPSSRPSSSRVILYAITDLDCRANTEATGEARSNTWWDWEIAFKRKLCMEGDRVIVWRQTIVNTARRAALKMRPTA